MNELGGYDMEDLVIGMSESLVKTVNEQDIVMFANASGDHNPLHLDEEYARGTRFGGRVAHGMLSASVISAALAGRLPGPGTVYVSQTLNFRRPVMLGETIRATVEIRALDLARQRVLMSTRCEVNGKVVVDGEAVVGTTSMMARSRARPEQASDVAG